MPAADLFRRFERPVNGEIWTLPLATATDRQMLVAVETEPLTAESPSETGISQPPSPDGARRFTVVSLTAILIVAVPYGWVCWDLWNGTIDPFRRGPTVSVYDVQAHAILHGHLSLPPGSIGPEGFVHDGRTYTYFGLFPSLIRIPVLLLTHTFDGRLASASIVLSWLVTATFASLLLWRIRTVVRGNAILGWTEAVACGTLLASILAGSVLVFLASEPNSYSEDLAWSVALCCGSLFTLLGVLERPSWGRVVASGLLVLLTNLNRATTGYACVLATLAIAGWLALGRGRPEQRRWALPMLAVGTVALIIGSAIDLAKFSLFFGVPASEQLLYAVFGFAHVNGGHYFGIRFLPSTLQAYALPGGLRITSVFPFLTLPDLPTHLIAHTPVFTRAPTASVPASMPLLFGLGLWGVVASLVPHRPTAVRALRILLAASAVSAGAVLIFGWILERFLGDFMPLLLLASMIGLVDIWRRLSRSRRSVRILIAALVGMAALFGFVANIGIAVTPQSDWTDAQAVHFVQTQRTISDITGHPLASQVKQGNTLPAQFSTGQVFIVGHCQKLLVSIQSAPPQRIYLTGQFWLTVERAPHTPICNSLLEQARRGAG